MVEHLGLNSLYVKDESYRFGLNAFKVLGGSYSKLKEALKHDENSGVLLVSSEGDMDPERYHEIVWERMSGTDRAPFSE